MSDTDSTAPAPHADAESSAERNWRIVKKALLERIGARRAALVRLAPDSPAHSLLDFNEEQIGDDATLLLKLLDDTERTIDRVFANRSRRPAETTAPAPRERADVDAFKAN